jgi:predicted Zn-dependent protease
MTVGFAISPGMASSPVKHALWQLAVREQIELEQQRTVSNHPGVKRYVDGIAARLWAYTRSDLPPLQVRILQDSQEDALTYPNGVCYLTSGLLVGTRSRDQLAMIIAHELIHYVRQHAQSAIHETNSDARWRDASKPSSVASLIDAAERQADQEGFGLVSLAGFCRNEALTILPDDRMAAVIRAVSYNGNDNGQYRTAPIGKRHHLDQIAPILKANARNALQKGLWIKADDSISRYLLVRPDDPQGHFLRGEILRQGPSGEKGDRPETAYLAAIEIDHQFIPALQALGMVFFKNGQTAKARQYFEQCLSLSPRAEFTAYIRQYLQLCGE